MSTPNKPGADGADYSGSECTLGCLKNRSQIDFEIDFFERILSRDNSYVEVLCILGELFSKKGWPRRALQIDRRLAELRPHDSLVLYNLACSYALLKQSHKAVETLRRAVEAGYRDIGHMTTDPDLDAVRQSPEFITFLKEVVDASSETRIV